MEPQQQQQQQNQLASDHPNHHHHHQESGSSSGKAVASSSYLCRQSSTRWTPTTDQIRILKDLYYKEGVRSPNADEIQRISAKLRQFGKIEGKNVFYWFQNHKARERQKKRFTNANSEHHLQRPSRYPNFTHGMACPSSPAAAQMVGGCGYGHMSMESNYNYLKECGAAACGIYSHPSQSFQWSSAGVSPYPQSYTLMETTRYPHQLQFIDEDQEKAPELETLPLFPVHAQDSAQESDSNCHACSATTSSIHWLNPQTTLELSLNLSSYGDHQWPNY